MEGSSCRVEPSIYHTPVDHANNYTTDAVILYNVLKWSAILTPCVAWKPYARRFYNYYIHFTLYFIQLLLFMSFSFLYLQTLKMLVAVVITVNYWVCATIAKCHKMEC
jgi:hypothetical protein